MLQLMGTLPANTKLRPSAGKLHYDVGSKFMHGQVDSRKKTRIGQTQAILTFIIIWHPMD